MKRIIEIGATVWRDRRGFAFLIVEDAVPGDPQYQHAQTIGEYKQRFGGMQGQLRHPAGDLKFIFDLSPWSQLADDTHLRLQWRFVPERNYHAVVKSWQ
ncbi:MAG TPA: hypothetical protein VKX46_00955 [Ktedonobacteraceae bacterium]|nr:hypothetical protein [Ktedonobacteraceae bacterium]